MTTMNYIGLDVRKKAISYCVKDASGRIEQEGKVGSTRRELDGWMKTLHQPWAVAMEETIFTGWIYDHLLPHAAQIKVTHPLVLRARRPTRRTIWRTSRCRYLSGACDLVSLRACGTPGGSRISGSRRACWHRSGHSRKRWYTRRHSPFLWANASTF